jgi:protein-disulfide isomerase
MSKKQEIKERRRKEKQQRKLITFAIIIIGVGLISAALIYPSTQINDSHFESRYMANDNTMGNPDAPIQIVEYSDYKCGHCGSFAFETEPLLVESYIETDTVYIAFY